MPEVPDEPTTPASAVAVADSEPNSDVDVDDTPDADPDSNFDKERALNTIRNLRASEKSLTKKLKDEASARKALEDASRTEAEKIDAELKRLQALEQTVINERRVTTARNAFNAEAAKAGVTKPDALFKLATDDLTFDDEGKPTNAKEVIKALREEHPYLFNSSSADGSSGKGRGTAPQTMNDIIRNAYLKS